MSGNRFLLLADTSNGRSAHWAVAVVGGDFVVYFGKIGSKLRRSAPALNGKAPLEKAEAAVAGQLRQGYQTVGTCLIDGNSQVADVQLDPNATIPVHGVTAAPAKASFKDAALLYEVIAPDWNTLSDAFKDIMERMEVITTMATEWVNVSRLPTAVPKIGGFFIDYPDFSSGRVRQTGMIYPQNGIGALIYLYGLRAVGADHGVSVTLMTPDDREPAENLQQEETLLKIFNATPQDVRLVSAALGLVVRLVVASVKDTSEPDLWF